MDYPTTSSGVKAGGKGKDKAGLETSEQEMSAGFGNMEATDILLGSVSMGPEVRWQRKNLDNSLGEFDLGKSS